MRALFASWCAAAAAVDVRRGAANAANMHGESDSFMLVSGITAPKEQCLVVEGGRVDTTGAELVAMDCVGAIAAGDGREVFSFSSGGLLMNAVGKHCVALAGNDVANGGKLVLESCDVASKHADGRSKFELQGNGQLRLGRDGEYCVSQIERSGGNVALHAAASATSTADAVAHNAGMAVDGRSDSFWASLADDAVAPVELVIDFGAPQKISAAEIMWAYAAKDFAVQLYVGGVWDEVFSTDVNTLNVTRFSLGARRASKAKLILRAAHPLYGRAQARSFYGVSDVAFFAGPAGAVVDDCSEAAKSPDARDKYFLSSVAQDGSCPGKTLVAELPALEAAKAAVAGVSTELAASLARAGACGGSEAVVATPLEPPFVLSGSGAVVGATDALDEAALRMLLLEARGNIMAARAKTV